MGVIETNHFLPHLTTEFFTRRPRDRWKRQIKKSRKQKPCVCQLLILPRFLIISLEKRLAKLLTACFLFMILPCGLGADNLGMSFLMPGAQLIRALPSPGTISGAYSKVRISWEATVNWKQRSGTTDTGVFRTSPFLPFPDAFIRFKPPPNQQITEHCNMRRREKRRLFFLWAFPTAPRTALHRLPRSRAGTRTTP